MLVRNIFKILVFSSAILTSNTVTAATGKPQKSATVSEGSYSKVESAAIIRLNSNIISAKEAKNKLNARKEAALNECLSDPEFVKIYHSLLELIQIHINANIDKGFNNVFYNGMNSYSKEIDEIPKVKTGIKKDTLLELIFETFRYKGYKIESDDSYVLKGIAKFTVSW